MKGSSQALYRQYRSTSFDDVVGQEHVTELLKNAVAHGTTSHAYLFTGPKGTGKTSVARILAYALNSVAYDTEASHLDIIEIDAASNRRIDDIRDLREKVHIAPVSARYKVYIVDEVHMLTGESFNALLKTLEEPPAHAVFILATTELHKVPATIISRTQRFHFRPIPLKKVVKHLATIAANETIDIEPAALELIAEHGGGSFRDSIGLLDQLRGLDTTITASLVESVLGRARATDIQTIITLLSEQKHAELHSHLTTMMSEGISPATLAEQLVHTLLRSPLPDSSWYTLTEQLMAVSKAHFPALLLTSTLLGFTANAPVGQAPSPDKPSDPQPAKPAGVEKTVDTPTTEVTEVVRKSSGRSAPFDWNGVLTAVKKTNPALHSVLSRAEASLVDGTLTLHFQYSLHRKKLEQPQYKTQLSRVMHDLFGINPAIVVEDSAVMLATNDQAKQVADLMGGGESVTV